MYRCGETVQWITFSGDGATSCTRTLKLSLISLMSSPWASNGLSILASFRMQSWIFCVMMISPIPPDSCGLVRSQTIELFISMCWSKLLDSIAQKKNMAAPRWAKGLDFSHSIQGFTAADNEANVRWIWIEITEMRFNASANGEIDQQKRETLSPETNLTAV